MKKAEEKMGAGGYVFSGIVIVGNYLLIKPLKYATFFAAEKIEADSIGKKYIQSRLNILGHTWKIFERIGDEAKREVIGSIKKSFTENEK